MDSFGLGQSSSKFHDIFHLNTCKDIGQEAEEKNM